MRKAGFYMYRSALPVGQHAQMTRALGRRSIAPKVKYNRACDSLDSWNLGYSESFATIRRAVIRTKYALQDHFRARLKLTALQKRITCPERAYCTQCNAYKFTVLHYDTSNISSFPITISINAVSLWHCSGG